MTSNKQEFSTAILEDGTCAVLRADPAKSHVMEVIATFHDAARARAYVNFENNSSDKHPEKQPAMKLASTAKLRPAARTKPKPASGAKPTQALAVQPAQAAQAQPKPASVAKPAQASAVKPAQATQVKPKLAPAAKHNAATPDISERQTAVLTALRSRMDKKNFVEVRANDLAKASSIPLGSVHSVLVSLEKKGMIRTERQGSAKFRAIYQVLETSRKGARPVNGLAHDREAQTKAH